MKIYTGTGDRGNTGLFSGERVVKDHPRIEAYGDIDELNSLLGALLAALEDKDLILEIQTIQSDLLRISAWLATTPSSPATQTLPSFSREKCRYLEASIDRMAEALPELKGFILPGGHPSAAWAHVARTVCRRAERRVVQLSRDPGKDSRESVPDPILIFMNRLSDYLFMLARYCNHLKQTPDTLWKTDAP